MVRISTSKMWSKLTSRHMTSLDLLRFLDTGDRNPLHWGQWSRVGLNVLGQPSMDMVSLALHSCMLFKMLLSVMDDGGGGGGGDGGGGEHCNL